MYELMVDWEAKKTDYQPKGNVWISVAGILDELNMGKEDLEDARRHFNASSTVRFVFMVDPSLN